MFINACSGGGVYTFKTSAVDRNRAVPEFQAAEEFLTKKLYNCPPTTSIAPLNSTDTFMFAGKGQGTALRMRHLGVKYVGIPVLEDMEHSMSDEPMVSVLCLKPYPTAHLHAKQYAVDKNLLQKLLWFPPTDYGSTVGSYWHGGDFSPDMESGPFMTEEDMLAMERECRMQVDGKPVSAVVVRRMYPGVPLYIPPGYLHALCFLKRSLLMFTECTGEEAQYGLLKSAAYQRAFLSSELKQYSHEDDVHLIDYFVSRISTAVTEKLDQLPDAEEVGELEVEEEVEEGEEKEKEVEEEEEGDTDDDDDDDVQEDDEKDEDFDPHTPIGGRSRK